MTTTTALQSARDPTELQDLTAQVEALIQLPAATSLVPQIHALQKRYEEVRMGKDIAQTLADLKSKARFS
jgi:hypothetical protein